MDTNGKQLEGLVAFVEKTLLPQGFDVKTNERIYNDEGVQIAEFDIEIHGAVGSTNIAWLIECRDRPGQGPAPGSWIEQLVGRRMRFCFNKVTAVSTTGFASGATEFALAQGIELREVKALTAEEFSSWLQMRHLHYVQRVNRLDHALILINPTESEERREALAQFVAGLPGGAAFLTSAKTRETATANDAFLGAIASFGTLFDDLEPNGRGKKVELRVQYQGDEDHYIVDTPVGAIRVEEIVFYGELSIREKLVPLVVTAEYRHAETGERISEVASFEPQEIYGVKLALEMHRIAATGETHVLLRKLPDDA